MTYTVDYFIEKFSKIPKEKWCVGDFTSGSRCCVLGHCGESHEGCYTAEGDALRKLYCEPAAINDNDGNLFSWLGAHPRTRILNALKRVKKGLAVV